MTVFAKLCAATALVAATATATFTEADIAAMARVGKLRVAATSKDLDRRCFRTARPGRDLAQPDPLHNGTVTVRFSDDRMRCANKKYISQVPTLKCLRDGEGGTSSAYSCGIQALNIAKIAAYKGTVPPTCGEQSAIEGQALICDQCVKNKNSTSSMDKFSRVQCLRTSTQTGARLLECPDERCDPKHCAPVTGGLTGDCFSAGPQDVFLKSVETGAFIVQATWSNPNCEGEQDSLVLLPAASCISGYTFTCDNKL